MKRIAAALAAFSLLFSPQAVFAQTPAGPVKDPNAHSYARSDNEFAAAIVIDEKTGKVLYEYNADATRSAASLTKLMGAMVFVEKQPSWNKVVDIRKQDEVGGGRLQVASGSTMRVIDVFYSSVTASANNAATALARYIGLGQADFVKAMNKKAVALGLTKTNFVDPSGMDPKNVTTAREMAKLASAAYDIDAIRRAATTGRYTFKVRNTGQSKVLKNTNEILIGTSYDDYYVTGGKTGFLYESMYNLALRVRPTSDGNSNRQVIVVVLGSQTRDANFKSAASLANWAWKAYKW